MKKLTILIIVIIITLIIISLLFLRGFNGGEDSWIKDSKGAWIKHGSPSDTPFYVAEQQDAAFCANDLFIQAKNNGIGLDSQCLGNCGNYSVDIVHVPRIEADNLRENQCKDFNQGTTKYFIELDSEGNLVRIFD